MKSSELLASWKIALIYFLIYTLIIFGVGVLYSVIQVIFLNSFVKNLPLFLKTTQRMFIPFIIALLGMIGASKIIREKLKLSNIEKITQFAALYKFIFDLVFLIRDLLITQIDGIPIIRNHPRTIISACLSLTFFYIFTRIILKNTVVHLQKANS